jgi:hypothetical protein
MTYMLLIYLEEKSLSESERSQCYQDSSAFARELHERGQYLSAAPLHPTRRPRAFELRTARG